MYSYVPPPRPGEPEPVLDFAQHAINFGPVRIGDYFTVTNRNGDRFTPDHPFPRAPEPAGSTCHCPACRSEGWYTDSPMCRFWRAHCEACGGTRRERVFAGGRCVERVACELCQEAWTEDVRFFRRALFTPGAVLRDLRATAGRSS